MKAPDKIYLPIIEEEGRKLLCTNWWEEDRSPRNAYVNETIEYIRKDALLEWAENRLTEFRHIAEISNDVAADGEVDAFEEVIDKINSL